MGASAEFLIVGQGLAGTLLSYELWRRKKDFLLADEGNPSSASRAAAGLFSPVTGQRTALMWQAEALLAQARESYLGLEAELGLKVFHPMPIFRVFTGEAQRALYLARSQEEGHQPWLGELWDPEDFEELGIKAFWGGMAIKGSGWVDVQGLIQAWAQKLKSQGLLLEKKVEAGENLASKVIFCTGVQARESGDFQELPFQPTKGESLVFKMPGQEPAPEGIYYGSHFAIPLGDGSWRAGATYDREDLDPSPTQAGLDLLTKGIESMMPGPIQVQACQTGIRPNLRGHFPAIGQHPEKPGRYVFNGLGSKGVLWAPWGARLLAEHLLDGREIPKEVEARRFYAHEAEKNQAPAAR